jgi:hypothetical protein
MKKSTHQKTTGNDGKYFSKSFQWLVKDIEKGDVGFE